MARIAGVDLPRNKRIEIALTYIYGLGRHAATVVLKHANISPDKRTDDLDENDVRKLRDAIDANFRVEGDLRHRRGSVPVAPEARDGRVEDRLPRLLAPRVRRRSVRGHEPRVPPLSV